MPDGSFQLTARQLEAEEVLNGPAKHVLLAGGSRSGKTFLTVRKIVQRALKAPGSRHAIARFRLNHVRASIVNDTYPKVLKLCFPGVKLDVNSQDLYARLPGGSQVWFVGLDDKARTEKILGLEFASIFNNEASQIPYSSRNMMLTRLAQRIENRATGRPLRLKEYNDCNPPDKSHWTYRLWREGIDPEERKQLPNPEQYAWMQINPRDNLANVSPEYLATLESMPARLRKRFLEGEWRDSNPNGLFQEEHLDRWRELGDLPEMLRIVVAIDPSGTEDDETQGEHDEIGIVVCGLGTDGNGYVLEDLTCNVGPAKWGAIACQAFERWEADCIVGETNFGGGMVGFTIQTARPRTPFRKVTASRGKTVRAEPVSALVELGKVRLAGHFLQMEQELAGFTTHGYIGERSPNRADAMIWGIAALFPELTKPEKKPEEPRQERVRRGGWMDTL